MHLLFHTLQEYAGEELQIKRYADQLFFCMARWGMALFKLGLKCSWNGASHGESCFGDWFQRAGCYGGSSAREHGLCSAGGASSSSVSPCVIHDFIMFAEEVQQPKAAHAHCTPSAVY